jgi:hypothetical protein
MESATVTDSPLELPWTGDDEKMTFWLKERLAEMPRPQPTEEDVALLAAKHGDVEPLRKLVQKQHPRWVRYINRPDGEPGRTQGDRFLPQEPEVIRRAIEDVERIRAVWQKHFPGKMNRPQGSGAVDFAAALNGIKDTNELVLALQRDEDRRRSDWVDHPFYAYGFSTSPVERLLKKLGFSRESRRGK